MSVRACVRAFTKLSSINTPKQTLVINGHLSNQWLTNGFGFFVVPPWGIFHSQATRVTRGSFICNWNKAVILQMNKMEEKKYADPSRLLVWERKWQARHHCIIYNSFLQFFVYCVIQDEKKPRQSLDVLGFFFSTFYQPSSCHRPVRGRKRGPETQRGAIPAGPLCEHIK